MFAKLEVWTPDFARNVVPRRWLQRMCARLLLLWFFTLRCPEEITPKNMSKKWAAQILGSRARLVVDVDFARPWLSRASYFF